MLESIGFCGENKAVIARFAPYSRQLPSALFYYKAKDNELAGALRDPEAWDPLSFDGDGSL